MPRPSTGKSKTKKVPVSDEMNELMEALARQFNLMNVRTGEGNRSKLLEMAVLALKVFGRSYPDNMPYPQALILEMELAVAKGDTRWEKHLDYLYSWSAEHDLTDQLSEQVIKIESNGDTSYIA